LTGEHPTSSTGPNVLGGSSSGSTSTTGASGSQAQAQVQDGVARAQAAANETAQNVRDTIGSFTDGQTKEGLAGDLAPSPSSVKQPAPEGTEHVTNIISAIGGAILSAPAAALEAVSPTAASKVSDAASIISAKMPALSLADAQAAAQRAAATVGSVVPEGTASTIQSYVGAASNKAQEVLPPALGGSTTRGNTGSGELAKPPSQLANEYAGAAQQGLSNAAQQAQDVAARLAGQAKETASSAAAVTQQKASEAASIAQQKGSEAASAAQQTAQNASAQAQRTAQDTAAYTQQKSAEAGNTAQAYSQQTQQSAGDLLNRAAESNTTGTTTTTSSTGYNHPVTSGSTATSIDGAHLGSSQY